MPTYNRVVYHEAKHETDVTAESTKIKLSTAALHTCRYVVSTAQDKPNQTSKQWGAGGREPELRSGPSLPPSPPERSRVTG